MPFSMRAASVPGKFLTSQSTQLFRCFSISHGTAKTVSIQMGTLSFEVLWESAWRPPDLGVCVGWTPRTHTIFGGDFLLWVSKYNDFTTPIYPFPTGLLNH